MQINNVTISKLQEEAAVALMKKRHVQRGQRRAGAQRSKEDIRIIWRHTAKQAANFARVSYA